MCDMIKQKGFVMDWTQFALFTFAMIGVMWSLKSDIQQNRAEAAADRRDILQLLIAIQDEIKDFHGRLCAIEERNKGK